MESLSETKWDVVIEGTGVQYSLLALALSRSNKKILHVDANEYYGGAEAAFSLLEVDEWVERVEKDSARPFRNASLWKSEAEADKLAHSRSYTLTLSPQIIYTRSKLLGQLVSSKVYRHLEFQAVGNWWILDDQTLKRLPNGREDIAQDKSIDLRAKRSLMKFLKFVVDYENQTETWQPHGDSGLSEFLSSQFKLPPKLQSVITALTLSLESPEKTSVKWALPRIARHMTSIGVFGPGFAAVVPKWGGGAEIAQVACRAGAVGGGVYVLGTGVESTKTVMKDEQRLIQLQLSNGETVTTKHEIRNPTGDRSTAAVSKVIAVVSSPLTYLFKSSVEGAPLAAVSVVVVPTNTLECQPHPAYLMVHSSETGECPPSQCVIYATTLCYDGGKTILDAALNTFLKSSDQEAKVLYSLQYDQERSSSNTDSSTGFDTSLDLAFNDSILDDVEQQWKNIMGEDAEKAVFMQFEDREGLNHDDDNVDEGY